MSLSIDVDRVTEVLLADGWHKVDSHEGTSSFALDAYEFIQKHEGRREPDILHGGGLGGICSTGATWQEKNSIMYCPLTAILAVRVRTQYATPTQVPTGVGKVRRFPK